MSTALVLGANGYIGLATAAAFRSAGYRYRIKIKAKVRVRVRVGVRVGVGVGLRHLNTTIRI